MLRRVFCKLLLVAVVVFWALSGVLFAQGRSEEAFERATAAQEKHTDVLMAIDGVEGTAVGLDGNDRFVVKVYTARPGVGGIPANLEKVPVQVEVTGKFVARADPTTRFNRPVPIGVSTGHPNITAGTIGCRVKDSQGNVFALSNNHVYANSNNASIGDSALQPGPFDGGTDPADKIGELYDFEPIHFARGRRIPLNYIDAAIAISSTSLLGTSIPDDGYVPNSETLAVEDLHDGLSVLKYGRTTGLQVGSISATNATVDVSYGAGKVARFVEQIVITPGSFSAGGDSGSLIVTNDANKYPVGLLFAGSDTHTIANPINAVLDAFGVTVDDGSGGSTPSDLPPTVSITSPTDGSTVFGTLSVTADAGDDNGVEQVEFFLDGVSIGVDGTSPYSASWDTTLVGDGSHTVSATATDTANQTATDSISVTVGNGSGGGTMHVSNIYMSYSTAGPNYFVYTEVTILDDSDNPVSYATVDLTTTLPDDSTGSGSGTTGSDGTVTFKIKSKLPGTYTSRVTDVTHASLTYVPAENRETSYDLTIP